MLSLDKVLKRLRANVHDVECFHYNGSVTKHIEREPDIETFAFPDVWAHGIGNANQQLAAVTKDLDRNTLLHKATQHVGGLPLHDSIKYILVHEYRFPLYISGESECAQPSTLEELDDLASQMAATMKALHDAGYVIWNFQPRGMLQIMWKATTDDANLEVSWNGEGDPPSSNPMKIYILSPLALANIRLATFKNLTNIINGCTIVSPYQIILDISCSKFENEETELNEFKTKMLKFWSMVLTASYKLVPDICQLYQSRHQGSSNYLDAVICRWCQTKRDDTMNKTYFVKDPSKLFKNALFQCVDWFAFGVVMDEFLHKIMSRDSPTVPESLSKMIYTCLSMDEPQDFLQAALAQASFQ